MKTVILDGRTLQSRAEVHRQLAAQLELPEWYGANLDALHDCLTGPLPQPVTIRLLYPQALEAALGPWAGALGRVLADAAAENPCLTYEERLPESEKEQAMSGFAMHVAHVGNPIRPDIPFDSIALRRLKALGFDTVQLNIAWGCRPGDEPLNLEDILSPTDTPNERQRRWFDEIARRAALAHAEGMRTLFHFGAPRMTGKLYQIIGSAQVTDEETERNSIQKEEIISKYETLLTMLAQRIPQVDDILVYTFDQEAWLGNEFGEGALAAGVPLHERIPPFLARLTACWRAHRPCGRLWWEPWEISAGTIYTLMDDLPTQNFGLMLHSNIAEVQKANPADRWLRNMALLAADRGIPVCGEVFLTGANEEVEPLQHAFAPALIWEQVHRLQELGLYGIKEYFGTRPDLVWDLDLAMAGICFADPGMSLADALAALAARCPEAAALPAAMAAAHRALAIFPWDISWRWRTICGLHTEWHPYTAWHTTGVVAPSPSWRSTRRALFMMTEEEPGPHDPWLIEDVGLRCREASGHMFRAAALYAEAAAQAADSEAAATFAAAAADFGRFGAVALDTALHAEETLTAFHIRRFADKGQVPAFLIERMRSALTADAENQKSHPEAVAEGTVSVAEKALADFTADPIGFCREHFAP